MSWEKLLSFKRLGREEEQGENVTEARTAFTRDYDRIIFSSAFRRLQDKTQVFPLAKSDYVRTRLTHSLEVASVGRTIGMLAGEHVLKADKALREKYTSHDFGSIVSAACLAHDIGNPPFGHSGESAIQEWFAESEFSKEFLEKNGFTECEKEDILQFEGNAQGFRTLCKLQNENQRGGLQLTCAVLATYTKYPRPSVVSKKVGISGKKFGFMQSEHELFAEVAETVGLIKKPEAVGGWYRHPLAFLVEAADDISYHIMDVEDGLKTGALNIDEVLCLHAPWLDDRAHQRLDSIDDRLKKAEYCRAITVNALTQEFVRVWTENLNGILDGSFDTELATEIQHAAEFEAFKKLARKKVYSSHPVVEIEACGFEVIGGLLDIFLRTVENKAANPASPTARSRTVLHLMPGGDATFSQMSCYERAIRVTDFVAGMTDSFAVSLYQRIRGISLP